MPPRPRPWEETGGSHGNQTTDLLGKFQQEAVSLSQRPVVNVLSGTEALAPSHSEPFPFHM